MSKGKRVPEKVRQKISKSLKGNIPWNKGKKLGPNPEHSKRMKGRRPWNKGIPNPLGRGKNCHLWKGGKTLLSQAVRTSYKYRQWRSDVFTRDNFICQWCGEHKNYLEAHHVKPFCFILDEHDIKSLTEALECEELWNINNGETLCLDCHNPTKGPQENAIAGLVSTKS